MHAQKEEEGEKERNLKIRVKRGGDKATEEDKRDRI